MSVLKTEHLLPSAMLRRQSDKRDPEILVPVIAVDVRETFLIGRCNQGATASQPSRKKWDLTAGKPSFLGAFSFSRYKFLMRLIIALILCALAAGCKKSAPEIAPVDPNGPVEVVVPEHGAYTGAFMDFGDEEDDVTLDSIEDFEQMVGKHQAIIASSSYWGEQNFPTANLNLIWRHGSLPLLFWSPWDKPYEQDHGPDRFSLIDIIAGKWDGYIDKWADAAREFAHPMIVVFGNEMNGAWFPWSGIYYGGNQWDNELKNWKGPQTYRVAYRHVVDRV